MAFLPLDALLLNMQLMECGRSLKQLSLIISKKTKMIKILIYVKEGYVQAVHANNTAIEYVIVDADLQANVDDVVSQVLKPDYVNVNLYEGFTDQSNPLDMEIRNELKRRKF